MLSETLRSPSMIPPRTSSHNMTNGHHRSGSKSVLKTMPEADWVAQSRKSGHSHSASHGGAGGGSTEKDLVKRISDDMIYRNGPWTSEKEKVELSMRGSSRRLEAC